MKAWLVLQEGPGAGYSYPLDPFRQAVLSIGRSADCDVTLADQRASRHHGDIRWNGNHWEIVDRGSTNGTYVNGLQVHGPYDLRVGDRITIGETTMVLREFDAPSPTPVRQPGPRVGGQQPGRASARKDATVEGQVLRPAQAAAQVYERRPPQPRPVPQVVGAAEVPVAFWLVQGVAAAAIVCLASGAFLPWLRVTGSLSQDLQPLVQGLVGIVSALSGPDSLLNFSQEINGLQGYGKLTLACAVIGLITMVADILFAFKRRTAIPGIVYLVSGLLATGAMGLDLINYYRFYDQIQSMSLLFGVKLADVVKVFGQFIEVKITPLIGLPLTAVGLVLLLAVGAARLVVTLLERR